MSRTTDALSRHRSSVAVFATLLNFAMQPARAEEYCIDGEGEGQMFCEAIRKGLNQALSPKVMPCIPDVVMSLPGVTDPEWEKLDYGKYEKLAWDLFFYRGRGPGTRYFAGDDGSAHLERPDEQRFKRGLDYLRNHRTELYAFRMEHIPEYVVLTRRASDVMVSARMEYGRQPTLAEQIACADYRSVWASPDFKTLMESPTHTFARPLRYRGQIYFASFAAGYHEATIYRMSSNSYHLTRVCYINYNMSNTHNCKGKAK